MAKQDGFVRLDVGDLANVNGGGVGDWIQKGVDWVKQHLPKLPPLPLPLPLPNPLPFPRRPGS